MRHGVAVGLGVTGGVGVGDGVGGVVAVAVAVGVGDPVAVGVGVPARQPISLNIWSGTPGSIPQATFLTPQEVQDVAKPPPGFCQAAAELDVTVRSVQPHSPPTAKSILAWTETQ